MEEDPVLSFRAKTISNFSGDRVRRFIFNFYLADQTLAVYEEHVPNSGFTAGRFYQRARAVDSKTHKQFNPTNFYVGARIHLGGREFEMIEAAGNTFRLMEEHANEFPEADIDVVSKRVKETDFISQLQLHDPANSGKVPIEVASELLAQCSGKITPHAAMTLKRAYGSDGSFDYQSLLQNN